jgi:nicotinamide phosphoribosyltransferase
MCSNFAIDGDEITMVKRLLTEIYPNNTFTMVSDSYDYWNLVDNILPQCKKEILEHNGIFMVRGDSGDPVEVVTKTVFKLWDIFGGTINSKGYKVLDPHVKAIYGDSITMARAKKIYTILEENGFAACNVSLGVGSFSMQCYESFDENGERKLSPFTRDTLNFAIKATYCETRDGKCVPIFKNPKEMAFKKSNKGCIVVYKDCNDGYFALDNRTFDEVCKDVHNELRLVFKDGKMITSQSLQDIRQRLHGGKF